MSNNNIVKTPANILVAGPTGCGKTRYFLDMLEKDYMSHFDMISLICPTYAHNRSYQEWNYRHDPDFIPVVADQDDVDDWLKFLTEISVGTNTLLAVDNYASSQGVKNRVSELVRLAFSARHYGISTIVLTQQISSIAKPYRENLSKLVTFYNPNLNDMKSVMDDFMGSADKIERERTWKALKDNKHARLEIIPLMMR